MMETEAIRENTSPRTKGLLGRLRRNKNPERTSGKSQVSASPIATVSAGQSVTREGVPVLTSKNADQFNPSDAHQTEPSPKVGVFRRKNRTRQEMILEKPPAARESAFSGPPRYDWIDIETNAAIKVQSAFRRNKVMSDLETKGISTAAIRNRARRRKAVKKTAVSEDVPSFFNCCGAALAFGDATTDQDWQAERAFQKEQFEEKKRVKAEKEEELKRHFYQNRKSAQITEQYEVVE